MTTAETAGALMSQAVLTGLEAIRSYGDLDEELYISSPEELYEESLFTREMITAEDYTRFIKKAVSMVRGSPEYKMWVGALRNSQGLDRCSFLSGLDYSDGEVGLEMHHCPMTLYEVVDLVAAHRLAAGQAITSLTLADETMREHFAGRVGVVPLSLTVHKLVHAGAVQVHPAMVWGDWVGLLRAYPRGATPELVAKVIEFLGVTEEDLGRSVEKLGGTGVPRLRSDAISVHPAELELLLYTQEAA